VRLLRGSFWRPASIATETASTATTAARIVAAVWTRKKTNRATYAVAVDGWFVAWGWWTLYGFPFDPRLWVAFFVHDLGYIGKPNMDGPEGTRLGRAVARRGLGEVGPGWAGGAGGGEGRT